MDGFHGSLRVTFGQSKQQKAGRARVHLPSEAGTAEMTIKRADADRAGARP